MTAPRDTPVRDEPRPTKKEYIEAAYQRIQDARHMGMGETAIRVELSTMWELGEAASSAALDVDEVLDLLVTCRGILAPKGYSGVTQRIDRLAARLSPSEGSAHPEEEQRP